MSELFSIRLAYDFRFAKLVVICRSPLKLDIRLDMRFIGRMDISLVGRERDLMPLRILSEIYYSYILYASRII
jgi:hypothetical protein